MKLKNLITGMVLSVTPLSVLANTAAKPGGDACALIEGLVPVFKTLQTLCFIGAAFCIIGWAWGFITSEKGEGLMKDLKGKGTALLVGFALLFGVAIIINFLPGMFACGANVFK